MFSMLLCLVFFSGCSQETPGKHEKGLVPDEIATLHGATMGTTYHVRYVPPARCEWSEASLQQAIDSKLDAISCMANPFDPESEISRFNRYPSKEPFPVSADFASLVDRALAFATETEGAYDPTIMPLVRLYGFGPDTIQSPPTAEMIESVKGYLGFEKVRVDESGQLVKKHPQVELDLSGMAKGYGVDQIHALLSQWRCEAWVVEIGGEIRASGCKPDGSPWRIGIEIPSKGKLRLDELHAVIHLRDASLATSGDYRNFRNMQDQQWHHIIDPGTAANPGHDLASLSIIHENCARADAFATAVMVLGPARGMALVEKNADMEALFIIREEDGSWSSRMTEAFPVVDDGDSR